MREVPNISVHAVSFVGGGNGNVMRLGIFNFSFAAVKIPFTPGSNNFEFGRESLNRQLKTNLIIAFTGSTMSHGIATFSKCNLDEFFGDNRAGKTRSQQIFFLVSRAGLECREDIIFDKIFCEVGNKNFRRAGLQSLIVNDVKFIALTDIRTNRYDFAAVIFFEPRNNNGRIEAAAVSQRNFFDSIFHLKISFADNAMYFSVAIRACQFN